MIIDQDPQYLSPKACKLITDLFAGDYELVDGTKNIKYRDRIHDFKAGLFLPLGRSLVVDIADLIEINEMDDAADDKDIWYFYTHDPEKIISDLRKIFTKTLIKVHGEEILNHRPFYLRISDSNTKVHGVEEFRSEKMEKLISFRGTITESSYEEKSLLTKGVWECSSCGTEYEFDVDILPKWIAPPPCSNEKCDDFGKKTLVFAPAKSSFVDMQFCTVQEDIMVSGKKKTRAIRVALYDDAVGSVDPGEIVMGTGILKCTPSKGFKLNTDSFQYPTFELHVLASNVQTDRVHMDGEIEYSEEELEKIAELPNWWEYLWQTIAPAIDHKVDLTLQYFKKAALLTLIGGSDVKTIDGQTRRRGNIHILGVGDSGTGKSKIITALQNFARRWRYCSAKSSSAVGIMGGFIVDQVAKISSIQAGAVPLASGGTCGIDEFEKMSIDAQDMLHEAMEDQICHIDKGGQHYTLQCNTNIIAAANPFYGQWIEHESIKENLKGIRPSILSRFDLIYIIRDIDPTKTYEDQLAKDSSVADHILSLGSMEAASEFDLERTRKVRSYIELCRRRTENITVSIPPEVRKRFRDFYLDIRMRAFKKSHDEGKGVPIPIAARYLEALTRIATAITKLALKAECELWHAEEAIRMLQYSIDQTLKGEDGEYDVTRTERGTSGVGDARIKDVLKGVQDCLRDFENEVLKSDLVEYFINNKIANLTNESQAEKFIATLQNQDYFVMKGDNKITGLTISAHRIIGGDFKRGGGKKGSKPSTDDFKSLGG